MSTLPTKSIYDDDIVNGDKFTSEKWTSLERPLDERERKTNEMIMNYGDDIHKIESMSNQPVILGEIYYTQIRQKLSDEKVLTFDNSNKLTENKYIDESESDKKKRIKKDEEKLKKIKKALSKTTTKVKLESMAQTISTKTSDLIETLSSNVTSATYKDNIKKHNYLE